MRKQPSGWVGTALFLACAACNGPPGADTSRAPEPTALRPEYGTRLSRPQGPDVKIEDLKEGTGRTAYAGDFLTVHYVGRLADGTEFDSSRAHGKPHQFKLGVGAVIKGWDRGLEGMKVGGKRRLTIPPSLAYGPAGRPPVIPPNAELTFEVELLDVQ